MAELGKIIDRLGHPRSGQLLDTINCMRSARQICVEQEKRNKDTVEDNRRSEEVQTWRNFDVGTMVPSNFIS